MIYLKDIDTTNWRLGLKVKDSQSKYVSTDTAILARAYAYRNHRSKAMLIYKEETPIGMVMYYDYEEGNTYVLSQFFIDQKHQEKGYGLEASKKVLELMMEDGTYKK